MNDEKKTSNSAPTGLFAGHLPLQNLLLAAAVIGGVSGPAVLLSSRTGFPFGHKQFIEAVGPRGEIGGQAAVVLAAILSLLSARGVAKLLLLPRRASRYYGYWLLVLNAVLGTLPMVGLDLLVTRVTPWWRWESSAWYWQGIALPNLAGWLIVNVFALLLATPALVDKRPVQLPPGLLPLIVWFALNAVCLAGCVSHVSDAALAVLAAPMLVVTMLAFQQHRRAVADCGAPPARG